MKAPSFNELKRRKERNRMAALLRARRSPEAAAAEQRRASLVGDGAKWRITNFKQVARAMSKCVAVGFSLRQFEEVLQIRNGEG